MRGIGSIEQAAVYVPNPDGVTESPTIIRTAPTHTALYPVWEVLGLSDDGLTVVIGTVDSRPGRQGRQKWVARSSAGVLVDRAGSRKQAVVQLVQWNRTMTEGEAS